MGETRERIRRIGGAGAPWRIQIEPDNNDFLSRRGAANEWATVLKETERPAHITGNADARTCCANARSDLYDRAQVDGFAKEVAFGTRFDYLVSSAGYFSPTPFLEHTRENFHQYHAINEAFFFLTQAVAQRMVNEKIKGSIVNIGSMWAKQAIKATPSSAYSMAKAGLHSLTQHLAMELSDPGIRVNAVSPAVVETPIYAAFHKARGNQQDTRRVQCFSSHRPLQLEDLLAQDQFARSRGRRVGLVQPIPQL